MNRKKLAEKTSPTNALHTNRNLEVHDGWLGNELIPHLKTLRSGSKVLIIGVGKGSVIKDLKIRFPLLEIYGTNYAKKAPFKDKNMTNASGTALPFRRSSFDCVASVYVMPYVPDKMKFLKEVHRVLKPKATAFVNSGDFINYTLTIKQKERKRSVGRFFARHPQIRIVKKNGSVPLGGGTFTRKRNYFKITKTQRKLPIGLRFDLKHTTITSTIGPTVHSVYQIV